MEPWSGRSLSWQCGRLQPWYLLLVTLVTPLLAVGYQDTHHEPIPKGPVEAWRGLAAPHVLS